jgi:hypothetical protein
VQLVNTLGENNMSTASVTPNPSQVQADSSAPPASAAPAPAQPTSRLSAILGAVARTADTGLAGIPAGGRPSFLGGLGQGARAEKQDIANQQAVKFKTFDDQVRMAELHNQDLKMQNDTQAQTDAHTKADLDNRALANSLGVDYDTIANHGAAVMDHLTAQTTANGASSVPGGTHLSGDGKTVQIPKDTQATRDGQKTMYNQLAPALGLPSLPPGASFVPPKNMNMLTNKIHGFDINGEPIKHEQLSDYISNTQTQRDAMAKNGASDAQLKTLDNMLGVYKANLSAADAHAATAKQNEVQATNNANTSPESIAGDAAKAAAIAKAQQPFKEAQARMEQTVKDGDPTSAGKMLANGDVAPSQIISTRNPEFAQKAFAAAKAADPNYNPQRAEGEFKVASSPTNNNFFASAKSLTDPNGTLDQLESAFKQLPNGQIPKLNKLADWTSAAKGDGATAGFAQTALGVADDYAKVMGGGQGSDSAREEMLKSFSMASSPKQMEAAIEGARSAIGSQMSSRIGSNKALGRMYGENIPQPSQFASAPGKPRVVSRDGGKTWQPALAQQ